MRNIDNYRNSKGEIWLNVASSTQVLEDFVNIDNSIFLRFLTIFTYLPIFIPHKYRHAAKGYSAAQKKALLIRHDCRKPLFFYNHTVDHILCSHFLEHVFPIEMESILHEFYRVLKPRATMHVIVPDLQAQAEQYLIKNRNGEPLAADWFMNETMLGRESTSFKYRFLELLGAFGLQHKWMYDHSSIKKKLQDIGFEILAKNQTPSKLYRLNDGSVHVVACKQEVDPL